MKPPFIGTKILDSISLEDIEPLIDREALFVGRWQLKSQKEKGAPILERILALCSANSILNPKIVYGYFECRHDGNGLIVTNQKRHIRFDFPREKKAPNRCVADFFPDGFIVMQIATVGAKVAEYAARLFAKNNYSDTFYLKGLAAEAAEATAEFGHRHIKKELGAQEDAGARFSPGFPSFPDIMSQKKIAALLEPKRIQVALTETCQMIPEYSTSAIVSIFNGAGHFHP